MFWSILGASGEPPQIINKLLKSVSGILFEAAASLPRNMLELILNIWATGTFQQLGAYFQPLIICFLSPGRNPYW